METEEAGCKDDNIVNRDGMTRYSSYCWNPKNTSILGIIPQDFLLNSQTQKQGLVLSV